MTALMGNTQLLGYFLDKGERSAAAIQGIGVISNYGVLFQVRPTQPHPCRTRSPLVSLHNGSRMNDAHVLHTEQSSA